MLDKVKIRRAFSTAAKQYDKHAAWQKKIAKQLLTHINYQPDSILDVGCGTGEIALNLKKQFPLTEVHGIDLAEGMIDIAEQKAILKNLPQVIFKTNDMERLDYPDESFSLVVSSLALQWATNLQTCFQELARVLKPAGTLLFSTIAEGSLQEIKDAYEKVFTFYPQENRFYSSRTYCEELKNAGFTDIHLQTQIETLHFQDFRSLAYSMKNIGAKAQGSPIMTRKDLKKLEESYQKTAQGLPLTYNVIFGSAVKIPI